jgi:sugar lactone lactonase YvrE
LNIKGVSIGAATLLALTALVPASAAPTSKVDTLVAFDPGAREFPEGIAGDNTGNLYMSMFLLDHVRRVDLTGAQTVFTELAPGAAPAGLKLSASGTLYVAATGFNTATGQTNPATRGVYRVGPDGSAERISGTEAILFPNDLTFDKQGNLYVTDAARGAVWRITAADEAVELWTDDPLLQGTGDLGLGFEYGANGIAFSHGRVVVANTERGMLVSIPIQPSGDAGEPAVWTESAALLGVDGIAFDVRGNVYAAINGQNTLVAVRNDGSIEVLANAADGLNQPSTVAFGTGARDHRTLFFVNFAVFSPAPTPGVLSLKVRVPGQPVP